MVVLLLVVAWLLLACPVLLLAVGTCRSGHREDIGRGYSA
jgi:hypothetical protein